MKTKIKHGPGVKWKPTNARRLYPWRELKRGQWFWTPKKALTMAPQASKWGDFLNCKFSCTKEGRGCRITRIK